jgi:hypothetical protein
MTEIMKIDMQKATTDPEAVFESPAEVGEQIGLTRGQKIATLERWAFSVRARVDALSEGMMNHPGGAYTRDVELVRTIEKAIEELRQSQS